MTRYLLVTACERQQVGRTSKLPKDCLNLQPLSLILSNTMEVGIVKSVPFAALYVE